MFPDEITRGFIYKQDNRNTLFLKKIRNIETTNNNKLELINLKYNNIYNILQLFIILQFVQIFFMIELQYNFSSTKYTYMKYSEFCHQFYECSKFIGQIVFEYMYEGYTSYSKTLNMYYF